MRKHDHQLKIIAKAIDKKIKNELKKLLANDREKYDKFFSTFGTQLKYGVYANYGMEKDGLKDLLEFKSSMSDGYTTLKEYVERMADSQESIYYACGESVEKIALLPQLEAVKEKGYEVLYCTDEIDEFAIQMLMEYEDERKLLRRIVIGIGVNERKKYMFTSDERMEQLSRIFADEPKIEVKTYNGIQLRHSRRTVPRIRLPHERYPHYAYRRTHSE